MKVLFAGGGSGGHIYPAIAIADYLKSKEKDLEILFIGTKRGLETKLIPDAGYNIEFIDIEGFNRKKLLKNISVLKKLIISRIKCKKIIKEFKPDFVIATGGYVSGPVIMAAKSCKIPSLIHEQNVFPGLTVKGSSKYVKHIAVSFEETINHLDKNKCILTGNPVRNEFFEIEKEKTRKELNIEKPFVLIFGGSLGATKINETVINMFKNMPNHDFQILFATGNKNYDTVMTQVKELNINLDANTTIVPYIDNMQQMMTVADLVICRSGAITLSELSALGKPSILIPSPNVVRNHQEQNAREFEDKNAAKVITEKDLNSDTLYNSITELLNNKEQLDIMSKNVRKFAQKDALEKIYRIVKN